MSDFMLHMGAVVVVVILYETVKLALSTVLIWMWPSLDPVPGRSSALAKPPCGHRGCHKDVCLRFEVYAKPIDCIVCGEMADKGDYFCTRHGNYGGEG